jgi:hypothetical protein
MGEGWRIVKKKHAATAFTGEGAAKAGGRWHLSETSCGRISTAPGSVWSATTVRNAPARLSRGAIRIPVPKPGDSLANMSYFASNLRASSINSCSKALA